jgi:AP-1-like factor
MDTFDSTSSVWQHDLLALFQKQYPYPLNTDLSLPALTPPSDDSSPSPPTISDLNSPPNHNPARLSAYQPLESTEESALKRKVSEDSLSDDGPTHKNPHIGMYLSIPT